MKNGDFSMNARLFPVRICVLDGSTLKLLAVVLMLIDHVTYLFGVGRELTLLSVGDWSLTLYEALRYLGRLAFPLFAFLLVEGFVHTKNRRRYARRLFLFALISEIPFNLFCSGRLLYDRQNVFFTLLFGFLALCALEKFKDARGVLIVVGLFAVAYLFGADYKWTGYLIILLLYALRTLPVLRALSVTGVLGLPAGAAALPIALYNGRRGFVGGRILKYGFYAFYPVHLLVLVLIKLLLSR